MTETGLGTSQKQDAYSAGKEAALLAKIKIEKYPPVLCFVFTSCEFAKPGLIDGIKSVIGGTKIIGCSSSIIFSNLGLNNYGVYVLLIASNELAITTGLTDKNSSPDLEKVGQLLANNLLLGVKKTRHLCLYFCDAFIENPLSLIKGIQDRLGKSFPIVGGFASDNLKLVKTFQYGDSGISSTGISASLFAGNVNFVANINHGWKPLGRPRIITKAANNVIYEIDGQPAIKIYEDFFGHAALELKKKYFSAISVRYPLGIYIKEEDTYVLRNILKAQNDGSLICQGSVPENYSIRLMIGARNSCLEATKKAISEIKDYFGKKKIYFCLILESAWRQRLLGLDLMQEFDLIKQAFGNIAFIGCSTYGEQVPLKAVEYRGISFSHNDSLVMLAFGE